MHGPRTYTVIDTAHGAAVYRLTVQNVLDLTSQLCNLDLAPDCALEVAREAWQDKVVMFLHCALCIVPGRPKVHTMRLAEVLA